MHTRTLDFVEAPETFKAKKIQMQGKISMDLTFCNLEEGLSDAGAGIRWRRPENCLRRPRGKAL